MAFPAARSQIVTDGTTATGTPAVNLPATVRQNDVLFVVFRVAVAGAIGWPAGWTELTDEATDASDDQTATAWKRAEGTEGGTTITLSCTSGKFAAIAYAIQDSADPVIRPPELSTIATGTSNAPNATTVTPTGGAQDYLWLTFTGREGEATVPPTYPTNYSVAQLTASSGTAGTVGTNVRVSGAIRTNNNAASEDAGAWTFSDSEDWNAYTIAFHPTPADPTPGTPKVPLPRVVRAAAKAAACVLAFVPVVAGAAPAADAVNSGASGQLTPPRVSHYTSIAGPFVAGQPLGWASTIPPLVRRPLSVQSVTVQPPRVDEEATTVGWLPILPAYARPYLSASSRIAAPPSETASAAQDVAWTPKIAPSALRPTSAPSVLAAPPIAATLAAVVEADALSGATGPMVWPRGAVQYTAVAGPVYIPAAATPDVGWFPRVPDLVRRPLSVPSVLVQPPTVSDTVAGDLPWLPEFRARSRPRPVVRSVIVAPVREPDAVASDGPIRFNDDGIIRGDRYTHHVAVAGPVAVPIEVGWWPAPPRLVVPRAIARLSVVAAPPAVLDGAGRSDLPWLPEFKARRLATPVVRSTIVAPAREPDADTTIGWWRPEGARVFRPVLVASVAVAPAAILDGAARSDLPWLPEFRILPRARPVVRSVVVAPVREPDASVAADLPWLVRFVPLHRALFWQPSRVAAPVREPDPSVASDLPWLPRFPVLERARRVPESRLAVPLRDVGDLAWLTAPFQGRPIARRIDTVIVSPLREPDPETTIGWWRPEGARIYQPVRVVSVTAAPPTTVDGSGRSDLPWLPTPLPLILAERVVLHVVAAPVDRPGAVVSVPGVRTLSVPRSTRSTLVPRTRRSILTPTTNRLTDTEDP